MGGTLGSALERFRVIVTADHGLDEVTRWLPLAKALERFTIADKQEGLQRSGKDLVIAGNGRMAGISLGKPALRAAVIETLHGVEGIDLVLYRDEDVLVAERNGRELRFARVGEGGKLDPYGNAWWTAGSPEVLDLALSDAGVTYGRYPNALERIEGYLLSDRSADIAVSLAPGFDLEDSWGGHQRQGDHGSLHAVDSLVPLLLSSPLPSDGPLRTVDVASIVLDTVHREAAPGLV